MTLFVGIHCSKFAIKPQFQHIVILRGPANSEQCRIWSVPEHGSQVRRNRLGRSGKQSQDAAQCGGDYGRTAHVGWTKIPGVYS